MLPDLNGNVMSIADILSADGKNSSLLTSSQMSKVVLDGEGLVTSMKGRSSIKRENSFEASSSTPVKVVIPIPSTVGFHGQSPSHSRSSLHSIKVKVSRTGKHASRSLTIASESEQVSTSDLTSISSLPTSPVPFKSDSTSSVSASVSIHTSPTVSDQASLTPSSPVPTSSISASEPTLSHTVPSSPESKKVCLIPVEENPYEESESDLSTQNKGETKAETKTYMGMTQKTWEEVP